MCDTLLKCVHLADGWYVGDNVTGGTGFLPSVEKPSKLVIPFHTQNGDQIEFIAKYAFFQNKEIEVVEIQAKLIAIHECAFFGCQNLRSINIPSTCTFLGQSVLDGRIDTSYSSSHLFCFIEKYSQLSYIKLAAISNFRMISLFVNDMINPICEGYFLEKSVAHIYSPYSFTICSIQTTKIPITIAHHHFRGFFFLAHFLINN